MLPSRYVFMCLLVLLLVAPLTGSSLAQDGDFETLGDFIVPSSTNRGEVRAFLMEDLNADLNIRRWQQEGWTGVGQRVGVIDVGFSGLLELESLYDFDINVVNGTDEEYSNQPIRHGTQVIEIVHRVAPRAEIFACQYSDYDGYTTCVDRMIQANVQIINHSVGVPALPLDGENEWAAEVDRAAREGILWINAAGNFASGYVEGNFTYFPGGSPYHAFTGGGTFGEALTVPAVGDGVEGRVMLSWEGVNGFEANQIDLDLEVHLADGQITRSNNPQIGGLGQRPLEVLQVDMSRPFGIKVRDLSANAGGARFVLFVEFAALPSGRDAQSIIAPADSSESLTIGALQDNQVAPYSSRGPIETGAIKPDIVAPGEIRLADGTEFIGTSAAAPVVTGVAALLWEANPTWTRETLYGYLKDDAIVDDSVIPGPDSNYGNGRLSLPTTIPQFIPVVTGEVAEAGAGRLPYAVSFDDVGAIAQWENTNPDAWRVDRIGGGNVLIGQAELENPITVMGNTEPEWLERTDEDIVVDFSFNLEQASGGLRYVYRYNPQAGYNVIELFPGRLFVKRNNLDNIDVTNRENEIVINSVSVPINDETWHDISLWISGSRTFIYLDNQLLVTSDDTYSPSLISGEMLFQANSDRQQVRVDNFSVQGAERASDRFESATIPQTWQTSNVVNTVIRREDNGNQYVHLSGDAEFVPQTPPLEDLRLSCRWWSEEGGFNLYLRETADGAMLFEFEGGNMTVRKIDDFGDTEWSRELEFFYNRGRWDDVTISLVGNSLEIYRDGELRESVSVGGRADLGAGAIRFETEGIDKVRIDDCLIRDLAEFE